jgi:hypothetical protein
VLKNFVAHFRLVYNEITYWVIGNTPEEHHANAAYFRYQLGHHRKCIEQCNKYLAYSQSDRVKSMLGYSLGAVQNWEEAALAYRSVTNLWEQPATAVGLAEAEFRSGNEIEARKILATVEVSYPQPPYDLALAIEQLNRELEMSSTKVKGN